MSGKGCWFNASACELQGCRTANNAAYEAARAIVIPGATGKQGVDEAERIMAVVGFRNLTVDVSPDVIDKNTLEVTVDIAIPDSQNAFFTPWFMGDVRIQSTSTLNAFDRGVRTSVSLGYSMPQPRRLASENVELSRFAIH